MRLTSKTISKAIEQRFGVAGVMVYCADGMCSFYSDTNEEAASVIFSGDNGVHVCRLNHLSLDQWLEAFFAMWQANVPERLKFYEPRPVTELEVTINDRDCVLASWFSDDKPNPKTVCAAFVHFAREQKTFLTTRSVRGASMYYLAPH